MGKAATVITATLVAVFFSGLANAGKVTVPTRSGSASTVASAIASRVGDIVSSGVIEGTYIPGYNQDRQIPVKVLNSNDFSARKTFEAATAAARRGGPVAAAVIASAALGWAVDQVGGFIDENGQPAKKAAGSAVVGNPSDGTYYWTWNGAGSDTSFYASSGSSACTLFASKFKHRNPSATQVSSTGYDCTTEQGSLDSPEKQTYSMVRYGSKCPAGSALDGTGTCMGGAAGATPFEQSDWDKLQAAMNNASGANTAGDPNFIRDLIRASCEGSLAPQRCYDSLAANAPGSASQHLSGPSSITVPGPSSTKLTTLPDGTVSSTTTTGSTTFNITYGNNYYNYNGKTVTQTTKPDGSTETTTEEEPQEETEKYPEQPDPLSPVLKEYDKVTEAVKTPQETVAGLDSKAWFSFGGSCQELDLDTPIGHIKTNYCPTVETYVKPVLGFIFAVCAYLYCAAIWRETTMNVRPT